MNAVAHNLPTVVQQTQRISDLECEVAELKEKLAHLTGETQVADLQRLFDLTGTEAQLLAVLHRRCGATVSKLALHELLYGDDIDGGPDIKIVDVFVCKIRAKLPPDVAIDTIWGQGYRLAVLAAQAITDLLRREPEPARAVRRQDAKANLNSILRQLYDNEVDVGIVSRWDAGWLVSIRGPKRWTSEPFNDEQLAAVGPWLLQTAKALYPDRFAS